MTTIQPILEQLENTNSQKEKIKILETLNEVQRIWFKMCYNPRITFGIKKIPDIPENPNKDLETSQVMDLYNNLFVTRKLTGNAAIEKLAEILSRVKELEPAIRLIQRDAKCGVNAALLNKVYPNLIPEIPCMLAHPMNDKTIKNIKFPCIVQTKEDGCRVIIFVDENDVKFFTRNGSELDLPEIKDLILSLDFNIKNFMLDGELLAIKNGALLDRKTGNGICNKAVRGTISNEERQLLGIKLWDFIEGINDKTPYNGRFLKLERFVSEIKGFSNSDKLQTVDTDYVNSMEEAQEIFESDLKKGLEGVILKNIDSVWEDKRSKHLLKMKEEKTADLEVIAVDEGDGDFEGGIGALTCITRDGKLKVNVGTGLSLEDRGFENDLSGGKKVIKQIKSFKEASKKFLGKIVEVKYNQLIKAKDKEEYSLFLPRLVQVRLDKDQANSIEEI